MQSVMYSSCSSRTVIFPLHMSLFGKISDMVHRLRRSTLSSSAIVLQHLSGLSHRPSFIASFSCRQHMSFTPHCFPLCSCGHKSRSVKAVVRLPAGIHQCEHGLQSNFLQFALTIEWCSIRVMVHGFCLLVEFIHRATISTCLHMRIRCIVYTMVVGRLGCLDEGLLVVYL